jgi:hypothetical protein
LAKHWSDRVGADRPLAIQRLAADRNYPPNEIFANFAYQLLVLQHGNGTDAYRLIPEVQDQHFAFADRMDKALATIVE